MPPLSPITVRPSPQPGKVWLDHRDGEGGQFDAAEVAAVIQQSEDLEAYFWEKF